MATTPSSSSDRRSQEPTNSETQPENSRRSGDVSSSTNAAEPRTQARVGGQGAVRSEADRRLQDNLTPQQRSEIGRKGGAAVSQNRDHMASIGRKGGESVSQNREHMASIGRKGGEAVSRDRDHMAAIGSKGGRA